MCQVEQPGECGAVTVAGPLCHSPGPGVSLLLALGGWRASEP